MTIIHFDTVLLNFIGGSIVPIVVAIVTTRLAPGWMKSLAMLALAIVSTAITVAIGEPEGGWPLRDYLLSLGQTIIASGVVYEHILKPFGVTPGIAAATKNLGIGPKEG